MILLPNSGKSASIIFNMFIYLIHPPKSNNPFPFASAHGDPLRRCYSPKCSLPHVNIPIISIRASAF